MTAAFSGRPRTLKGNDGWFCTTRAPDTRAWLCAAVSERMLEEVEAGRAAASDVFHHSLTGTVEIVRAGDGEGGGEDERHDRCIRCADLPESLISGDGSIRSSARGRAARSVRAAPGATTTAARTPSGGRRSCGAAKPRTRADGRPGRPRRAVRREVGSLTRRPRGRAGVTVTPLRPSTSPIPGRQGPEARSGCGVV